MLGRAISEYKYQPPPSSQSSQATAKIAALKQSGGNVAPKPADGSLKETPKRNTSSISGWTANSSSRAANPIARTSGLQSLPGTYSSRPSEDRKRSYNTMAGSEAAARTPSSFEKVNNWNVSRPRTNRQGVIDLEADVVDLTNDEAPQRSHLPATKVVEYDWDDDIENDSEIDIDMEYPLQLPKAPPVQPLPPVSGNDYAPQSQSASSMLPPKTPINSRGLPIPSSAQTWSSSPAAHLSKPDPPREMRQAHEIDLIQPESSEPPRAAKRRTTPWAQKAAEQPAKRTAEPPVEKAVCTVPYESCYVCEEPGHVAADCPKHPKKQRAEAAAARNSFTPLPQDTSLPWNGNAKGARTRDMDIKKYQKTVRSAKNAAAHADMFAAAATVHDEKHPHVKAQTSKEKAAPQIFLSKEQQDTLNLVIEKKKSVFFTGSAGTGKSVLMRAIIADLQRTHKREPEKVAVTASTGLAACNIGGVTLHSFSGIGLGKEDVPVLVKKIMRNQKAKNRWLKCKVLVIDEISMVDGDLFDKLEAIARSMKKNSRPFGGIQLVVTGDFFQLPPVPDYGSRNIKFAFDADTWSTSIHHTIGLTEVFRQRDPGKPHSISVIALY